MKAELKYIADDGKRNITQCVQQNKLPGGAALASISMSYMIE